MKLKRGDIIKIVGLYVNDGNSNTIYSGSGTNPHNIGLKNFS